MKILVIDFDRDSALTLSNILNSRRCEATFATTIEDAIALLGTRRFEVVLMDIHLRPPMGAVLMQKLYQHRQKYVCSPRVCLLSKISADALISQAHSDGSLDIIPANAESIFSIVESARDNDVILVSSAAFSTEVKQSLQQEGYPAVVRHDLDGAVRMMIEGSYSVVILETDLSIVKQPDECVVLRKLNAISLASLASMQTDSYLRFIETPKRSIEVAGLLAELRKDLHYAELHMVAGRA